MDCASRLTGKHLTDIRGGFYTINKLKVLLQLLFGTDRDMNNLFCFRNERLVLSVTECTLLKIVLFEGKVCEEWKMV